MRERIERLLEHLVAERGLSSHTIAAYRNDLGQFARYLESAPSNSGPDGSAAKGHESVGRQEVVGFLLSLKDDRGYAPATVARKMAAVKSLCHYLHRLGELAVDPTAELSAPQVKKSLPRSVSAQVVNRLLDQAERRSQADGFRDRAMLNLLYSTGMRVTELVSLNLSDLELDRQRVRCTGRAGRVRLISLDRGTTISALRHYLEHGRTALAREAQADGPLFLNRRGRRLTRQGFWLIMKLLAREAGIGEAVTPHVLRHSFATHRLQAGIALKQLKEILGHANISSTQVYAQLSLDGRRAAAPSRAGLASD